MNVVTAVSCKQVVKKAWKTRKEKYGESGFSKKGLNAIKKAARARAKGKKKSSRKSKKK